VGAFRPACILAAAALLLGAPSAAARLAEEPWPPVEKRGLSFVHFGEEHVDDDDGPRIYPRVVRSSARYRPELVTASADKASDNSPENFATWTQISSFFDRKQIPYFAAIGNHDRSQPGTEGLGSIVNGGSIGNYLSAFADRPYPFGDAPPVATRGFAPTERPASDPAGASTHYAFEARAARFIFLDNSCFSFLNCDPYQNPPLPDEAGNASQYAFLRSEAAAATAEGQLAFVVMHMPTQDPRPGHTEPTPNPHNMGEGTSPENASFEEEATAAGLDGVFAGHIKGQWVYEAGGVPYFIDGGAGGEVYAGDDEETGVDSGYWHGYRLVTIRRGQIQSSDTIPVFADSGIEVEGPEQIKIGEKATFTARGEQPTEEGPRVTLELRDPSPEAANYANLPTPARIWTTSKRRVLAPIGGSDSRRDGRSQTETGTFKARCPGRAMISVTSGFEEKRIRVAVTGEAARRCD
jgi:hypothetical protein